MPTPIPARFIPIMFAVLIALAAVAAVLAALHGAPAVHGHEAMMHKGPNIIHNSPRTGRPREPVPGAAQTHRSCRAAESAGSSPARITKPGQLRRQRGLHGSGKGGRDGKLPCWRFSRPRP